MDLHEQFEKAKAKHEVRISINECQDIEIMRAEMLRLLQLYEATKKLLLDEMLKNMRHEFTSVDFLPEK